MNHFSKSRIVVIGFFLITIILIAVPIFNGILTQPTALAAPQEPQACVPLSKPSDLPTPALINFDDLKDGALIGDHYKSTFGVSFENNPPTAQGMIFAGEPNKANSSPNVAINNTVFPSLNNNVPLVILFDSPKTDVGLYIGNSENSGVVALLTAYDANGRFICEARFSQVPEPTSLFIGLHDQSGGIVKVTLDYGDTNLSETIDDLFFAPRPGMPPVREPEPTWTPIPSPTPTPGPLPTPTAVVPMYSFKPPKAVAFVPPITFPDLSIHGIEITQGIQCFDTSKGVANCADNSLPLVNKKDSAARIYLKIDGVYDSLNNVPVRLFLTANGVTYQADSSGIATPTINQGSPISANIYFNVNFNNTVQVNFYAIVDPDNIIKEYNESNNRYPASGSIQLSFQNRTTLKVVGERVDYHPAGYSGTRKASGWAVNGGAADWWEQILPVRNNGINYSIASGYLDWTKQLSPCNSYGDNQHSLIQYLNLTWMLDNSFSFWFTGSFKGANHVYGWAPDSGYSCGHADMPVYPHSGGLGVVAIGTDKPGTNTDNPGKGAFIFGHELVHDHDIKHTDTSDSCGSNDNSSLFPYANSSIQEFGFNPITGKIYNPADTHDLMSYCPSNGSKQGWISPYTWQKMFDDLSTPVVLKSAPSGTTPLNVLSPSEASESLVVEATIFNPDLNPDGGGKLGNLYKVGGGSQYVLPSGPYAIELLNDQGVVLATQSFDVNFESEYDAHGDTPNQTDTEPPFPPDPNSEETVTFIMPWVDGTTHVNLSYQRVSLDLRAISNNPPQVFITNPTLKESWTPGTSHTLSWQGLDLDGDVLSYSVFYSFNGGASWNVLASELTSQEIILQTDSLAGGSDVRFRVVATDGVLTGLDETDQAISVPNHAPNVIILNPENGMSYPPGDLVVLEGMATDMEDGTLPDESLHWSSDIQGGLGIGPSLALNSLKLGTHLITLSAADNYGVVTTTSVTVIISYQIYVPSVENR
jgi:hypothetical protein